MWTRTPVGGVALHFLVVVATINKQLRLQTCIELIDVGVERGEKEGDVL